MKVEGQLKCCKCDERAVERAFDGTGWCEEHFLSWKSFLRRHRGEFQGLSDAFDAWIKLVRFCDEDCNHCPIICHPNNRLLTKVLNELLDRFGNDVYKIVQGNCPNLTVCYDCRIDDFCHIEGCRLSQYTQEIRIVYTIDKWHLSSMQIDRREEVKRCQES